MALPTEHQATAPSGTESKRHHQHKQRHFALIVFGAVVCGMIIGAFFPTAKIPASTTENTAVADGSSVVGSKLFDRQTPELAKKLENGKAQSGKKTTGSLVIALDPGHGGIDPGSKAHNGLIEKYLTLDLARRVQLFLSEVDGLEVVLTRTNDLGMSRQERVDRIQEVGADIVVSLHFNHLPQNEVNLVETFIANRENVLESLLKLEQPTGALDLSFTDQSRQLADILHNKVYTEVARRSENVII